MPVYVADVANQQWVSASRSQSVAGTGGGANALTWAPPNTTGYTEYTLPTGGGVVALDDTADYVLTQTAPITKCVSIQGGRNVVWIGGKVKIDTIHSMSKSDQAAVRFYKSNDTQARIDNDGRIIHLEGFLSHGYYVSGDIQTNCPRQSCKVQNCRVEQGMWGRQTGLGDPAGPHPDGIQLWGGVKELRVDGLTVLSTYQGLQINEDLDTVGNIYLRNINVRKRPVGSNTEAGQEAPRQYPNYLVWTGGSDDIYVEDGTVWIDHPHRAFDGSDANLPVWPETGWVSGTDGTGTYGQWPGRTAPGVRNWADTADAKLYEGTPPNGDFVLSSNVGFNNYTSPGYA